MNLEKITEPNSEMIMKKTIFRALSIGVLVCGAAVSAVAANPNITNDFSPPAWRGVAGSTIQKWSYDNTNGATWQSPNMVWSPEVYTNANGTPRMQMSKLSTSTKWLSTSAGWSTDRTIQGVFYVSTTSGTGYMTNMIPTPASLPSAAYNYVVFQVTHAVLGSSIPQPIQLVTSGTLVDSNSVQTASGNAGLTWQDNRTTWRVPGNLGTITEVLYPPSASVQIDAVIVDTLTVNPSHTNIASVSQAVGKSISWAATVDGTVITNEVCHPPSGTSFPIGMTTVFCTNVDLYAYTTATSFSVSLSLPPAPQFTQCAANQTNALGTACQLAIPDMTGGVIATGLWVNVSQSPSAGTMVGPGQHTVTFTARNDGGTNTCTAAFVVTGGAPLAVNDPLDATAGASSTMTAAKLLLNDSSPDGRAMQVVGVTSPSAQSGTVTFDGTSIVYTPASGYTGPDNFTYTNQDCAGLFSTAQVVINVTSATNFLNLVSITAETIGADQVVTVLAQGIPNYSYTLVRATQLSDYASNWVKVATCKASSNTLDYGQILYRDTNPPSASFYRTKYPPMP